MKRSNRSAPLFSDSIVQRLNAYALAAGAAGVGMLVASPAEAKVVYTPVKVTVSLSGMALYDLNPAGAPTAPFLLAANFTSPASMYWDTISFNPRTSGARFVKGAGTSWSIAPMQKGAPIGPGRNFGGNRGFVGTIGPYGSGTYKNHDGFKFGQTTYIGFKFLISGQTHYGWARVTLQYDANAPKRRLTAHLSGYAYETTADTPIKAGQTSGPATNEGATEPQAALPSPETRDGSAVSGASSPALLGLLALGAAGLAGWR
jgi:hypothetical protein